MKRWLYGIAALFCACLGTISLVVACETGNETGEHSFSFCACFVVVSLVAYAVAVLFLRVCHTTCGVKLNLLVASVITRVS